VNRPHLPKGLLRRGRRIVPSKPKQKEQQKATPEPAPESKELQAQRDRLLEKFTVMQADLGGAFYEMAIRDHVRLDVLTRKATELQRVDAELLAVERLLELERSDAAGLCPSCGSPYGPAVRFCPQCGRSLAPTEAEPEGPSPTRPQADKPQTSEAQPTEPRPAEPPTTEDPHPELAA
jgi:zinc-ribbon domain